MKRRPHTTSRPPTHRTNASGAGNGGVRDHAQIPLASQASSHGSMHPPMHSPRTGAHRSGVDAASMPNGYDPDTYDPMTSGPLAPLDAPTLPPLASLSQSSSSDDPRADHHGTEAMPTQPPTSPLRRRVFALPRRVIVAGEERTVATIPAANPARAAQRTAAPLRSGMRPTSSVADSLAEAWRGIWSAIARGVVTGARHLASRLWQRRFAIVLTLLAWAAGIGLALAAGALLTAQGIGRATSDELVSVGFDTERGRLIAAFALALLASGVSGLIVLRRGAAWLGGFAWFATSYLQPFYQQAQHPLLGPNGQPVTPLSGSLVHVMLTLAALGVLFSGAGAVLGEACGSLVLRPLFAIGRLILALLPGIRSAQTPAVFSQIARPVAAAIVVALALAVGAPDVGSLLSFGITTQLYQPAQALPRNDHGAVEEGTYASPALGGATRTFEIYLPPSYSVPGAESGRYPAIYLLHGTPGGPTNWFSAGHAADIADAASVHHTVREPIIVCPDGNGTLYRTSAWVNSYDNKQRMEDSIATDLVSYIDSHYRTLADPGDRAIGGLSEGAYGAANIALHRPDVFSKVMSLDGFYETTNNPVFGPVGTGYRNYNSPSGYIETPEGQKAAHALTFVIAVGKKDFFFKDGMAFDKKLVALGMKVQLIESDGGHSWVEWGQQFAQSLPLLVALPQKGPSSGTTGS